MTARIRTQYVSDGEFSETELVWHNPGYEVWQSTNGCGPIEPSVETVILNRDQAINYAKAILRNEGIHAID